MALPEFLDFPSEPRIGDKYPMTPVVGVPQYVWDGEKWTTQGGTVGGTGVSNDLPLMDGVANAGVSLEWSRDDHVHPSDTSRLAVTDFNTHIQNNRTNISLVGVGSFDIVVPAAAKQARLTGVLWNSGVSNAVVRISIEAGVFPATGYAASGVKYHNAEFGVLTTLVNAPKTGMFIYDGANNIAQPVQFDMTITLARPDVSRVFNCESRCGYFVGGENHHSFYTTYLIPVVSTRVLALRLVGSSNWLAESYLTVEWLG